MEEKHEIIVHDFDADEVASTAADGWEARYLRLTADFDNYRKRTESARLEQTGRIRSEVFKSILPIYDDFHHLLENAHGQESLLEGVKALQKSWLNWMRQHDLQKLGEVGEDFDYLKHEAVMQEPVNDPTLDGKVTQIIKYGYVHKDLVLRHAQVVVGRYEGPAIPETNHEESDIYDF